MINKIIESIKSAKSISVYGHINPDCDAISSMLTVSRICEKLGKDVDMYVDSDVPTKFKYLKNSNKIKKQNDLKIHDISIAVDCGDVGRLGEMEKSFYLSKTTIAIDHHISHKEFAKITLLDGNACSTTSILFRLVKELDIMDKDLATYIFAGIVTDCGCFAYDNTTKETHTIAAELMEQGINAPEIIQKLFFEKSIEQFKLKNEVLNKTEFFHNNQIALILFTNKEYAKTGTTSADSDGVISSLMEISTVKIAFAISEIINNQSYKISIRTKDEYDATEIALKFNGGGHKRAAGCRINDTCKSVKASLIETATQLIDR